MRAHERRRQGGFPYFKVAEYDAINFCFRDGKQAFGSIEEAKASARKPGRYRLSIVRESGREDLPPFEVGG